MTTVFRTEAEGCKPAGNCPIHCSMKGFLLHVTKLPTLPTASLPTAHCSLPTAHCPLPTAHYSLLVRQIQPYDVSRFTGLLINVQNDGANPGFCGGVFCSPGNRGGETRDDVFLVHPNHSGITTSHADIGQVSSALGQ